MPSHNINKVKLRERLAYHKSKTKWYMQENVECKRKQKQAEKKLATAYRKMARLEKANTEKIRKLRERANLASRETAIWKYQSRVNRLDKGKAKQELKNMIRELSFLGNEFNWDDAKQVEIVLRSIVAYTQLVGDGIVTYDEFIFLMVGSQRESFSMQDLRDRLGDLGRFTNFNFNKCVRAGYFKKIMRKQLWHITVDGQNRFEDIIKHIYTVKIGTAKEVKRLLEKV